MEHVLNMSNFLVAYIRKINFCGSIVTCVHVCECRSPEG
jgi:hypothetical protein